MNQTPEAFHSEFATIAMMAQYPQSFQVAPMEWFVDW